MSHNKHPYKKMEEAMQENRRLDNKVKEYKKQIKTGNWDLAISFETELTNIKLNELKTPLDPGIITIEKDYTVLWLDLDKVVEKHTTKPDKIYPKDKLWTVRTPRDIARLIEFIEAGNALFPPIIEPIEKYNDLTIIDGNHRIALFRFLKLSKVPFLVKKSLLHLVEELK